jgi:CheY-like chemotaxis protein
MSNIAKGMILVVEDDADIRQVMRECLELEGYAVITASNGKEALTLLNDPPDTCLILLDLFMPIMDGKEFLKCLRSSTSSSLRKLPVILVSAAPPQGEIVKEASALASGFIKKPVNLEKITKAIEDHCQWPNPLATVSHS